MVAQCAAETRAIVRNQRHQMWIDRASSYLSQCGCQAASTYTTGKYAKTMLIA